MLLELYIENKGKLYKPIVIGEISYKSGRNGVVGELSFVVKKDGVVNFAEGNKVTLKVNDKGIFKGYIFSKSRDKNQHIEVRAFDQTRYLLNKDTRKNGVGTVSNLIKTIAKEHELKIGSIDNTVYDLESRIESETSYMDMIMKDLVTTTEKMGIDYTFYDDFGELTLKAYGNMKVDFNVNLNNIENFSYSSSIESDTYNKIKIVNSNEESVSVHHIESDETNIKKWGVLQYVAKLEDEENADLKAKQLLAIHNRKGRKLSVSKVLGNVNVRAGSVIKVSLPLGDIVLNSDMCVENCTHSFTGDTHFMDLDLISVGGGEFVA